MLASLLKLAFITFMLCCVVAQAAEQTRPPQVGQFESSQNEPQLFARFPPTIELVMLIHPYNKAAFLPYTLGGLEAQNYPRSRIRIRFITERLYGQESFYDLGDQSVLYERDSSSIEEEGEWLDERLRLNDVTIKMLKRWTKRHQAVYNDIELVISNANLVDHAKEDVNYWSKERFKLIIDAKDQAIFEASRSWADCLLFLDADVLLVEPGMLANLTKLPDEIEDLAIVAPMLYSLGTYSNFWAGIDEKGYYRRTDDYLPILQRKQRGTFQVPMVHTAFFIDMRKLASRYLTFDPADVNHLEPNPLKHIPFDDVIAFAKSANKYGIPLYVNNEHVWGFVPEPIATSETSKYLMSQRQELIDLELEALVEKNNGFVISQALEAQLEDVHGESVSNEKLGVSEVYVINLRRRPDRRRRMLRSLQLLGVKAMLWNATDGRQLTEDYLNHHGIRVLPNYVDPYHGRPMTFGEIGCFLSHFRVWNHAWKNGHDKIIVLEDDVRFERNFVAKLGIALTEFKKLVKEDKESPDFLYLGRKLNGNYEDEAAVYATHAEANTRSMFVRPGYSYWTIGYMITRKGIGKLLDANPLQRLIPVDEFLPIMYRSHPNASLLAQYEHDEASKGLELPQLNALVLRHLLVYPTHYVGDEEYVSDTEDSVKTTTITNGTGDGLTSAKNMPREEEDRDDQTPRLRPPPMDRTKVEL